MGEKGGRKMCWIFQVILPCWEKITDTCSLKEESCILAHSFRGPSPGLAESKSERAQWKSMEEESCLRLGRKQRQKTGRRGELGTRIQSRSWP